MNAKSLLLFALVMVPVPTYADNAAHDAGMHGAKHGKAEGGHAHGVGNPGNPKKVSRTIQVSMSDDMKFTPAKIDVKRGETIRFVVTNAGRIKHEMVIGSMAELKQHAEMMRKMPGMEHDEPNQIAPAPGKSGDLIWQFTKSGAVDFACLQPGHFEAGMVGKVSIK